MSHRRSPASVPYWTNISQRIQCRADAGDLHGMCQGIKDAIGLKSKKTATV